MITPFIQVTWDGVDAPMRHTVSELGADDADVLPPAELVPELQPAAAASVAATATAARAVLLGRTTGPPLDPARGYRKN